MTLERAETRVRGDDKSGTCTTCVKSSAKTCTDDFHHVAFGMPGLFLNYEIEHQLSSLVFVAGGVTLDLLPGMGGKSL